MAHFTVRPHLRLAAPVALALGAITATAAAGAPAHADAVAYVINVTVRPGYRFVDAQDALHYGNNICDNVSHGQPYSQLIADIKTDLGTHDDYQASYLITQAVNELCPAMIWHLRTSAAHNRDSPP